jgi:very-short-patch-repair endonuclease
LRTRLATRQEGVVGFGQLVALGYTRDQIAHAVRTSRLIRRHKGVYAVGHDALTDRGRMIAALLAVGPGAVLSHATAAHVWSLFPSMPPFVHVTVTGRVPRKRRGIQVHQANRLATTTHHQLPITTPEQSSSALIPALRRADLPAPRVNAYVLGHRVDFHWPEHRLVVETDGWRTHGRRSRFESDRARDAHLHAAGWIVLRFIRRQVVDETLLVAVRIAQVLARGGVTPERTPHLAPDTPPAGG